MASTTTTVSSAAVLSRSEICAARESGKIRIEPFNASNLTNVAYDVSLGATGHFVSKPPRAYATMVASSAPRVILGNRVSVHQSWELAKKVDTIEDGAVAGILIPPRATVVAATHEFIGTMNGSNIVPFLRARSSTVRAGLTVSSSGCWGDVGFAGRWGLILTNQRDVEIFIPYHTRIAQIVFLRTTPTSVDEGYTSLSGTYGVGCDEASREKTFAELDAEWDASSLI
jgi:deoxycytidine triphosphate deaminase